MNVIMIGCSIIEMEQFILFSAYTVRMKENLVKRKLKRGEIAIGAAITTSSPDIAEMLSNLGFDWLFIDMEHAPLNIGDVQLILQAIEQSNITPIVRVPWNNPVVIKRVLDIGAMGVIVPWVNSKEEAEAAVKACKYPPKGIRGCGPRRAAKYGLETLNYLRLADEEIMVVVQIETAKAVKSIREILLVEGVDATLVGPMDLSASLGHLGNPDHPEVKETIRMIAKAHAGTNVAPGIASSLSKVEEHLKMGFRFLNVTSDCDLIVRGGREAIKFVKKLVYELT